MNCLLCNQTVGEEYRVNQQGDIFCNDECYESHLGISDRSSAGNEHPYIDTYEYVRHEYIDWFKHWQSKLDAVDHGYISKADELLDTIDEFIEEQIDFYITEGDDGVFAHEIYRYLLKFEDLQKEILMWRPERDEYFTLVMVFDEKFFKVGEDYRKTSALLQAFIKEHYPEYAEKLLTYMDEGFNWENDRDTCCRDYELTFPEMKEAEGAQKAFRKIFTEEDVDIWIDPAYLCDCGCGLFVTSQDAKDVDDLDGWHYDFSCAERNCPGVFSKEDLVYYVAIDRAEDVRTGFYALWTVLYTK